MRVGWDSSPEAVQGLSTCLMLYLLLFPKLRIQSWKMQFGEVVMMKEKPGVCFQIHRL